jgi:hypothetical protein
MESELKKNFLQWRDGQRILGIKFSDVSVAQRFSEKLTVVIR